MKLTDEGCGVEGVPFQVYQMQFLETSIAPARLAVQYSKEKPSPMPKKSETKSQTLPLETYPGDWGTPVDIAELEQEAEEKMQVALAAKAKVTAAKEAARNLVMKNIADQLTASDIGLHELARFMGIPLDAATQAQEIKKPKKEPAPPKFRNPETGETHSGRGQLPAWLREARDTGKLEEFRIK